MGLSIPHSLTEQVVFICIHHEHPSSLPPCPFIYYNGRRWKTDDCLSTIMSYSVLQREHAHTRTSFDSQTQQSKKEGADF